MQKVPSSTHLFVKTVGDLHDHLYGNANLREPESLHAEVAKVLTVLAAGARASQVIGHDPGEIYDRYTEQHPGDTIELDPASVSAVVEAFAGFDLTSADRDFVGDALETMRSTVAKRLGGQFFTDQRVTRLAVELLDYDPSRHDFVDICAGTGGFLIAAALHANHLGVHPAAGIHGAEIDPKIARLAQGALNPLDGGGIRVHEQDSLQPLAEWSTPPPVALGGHSRLASNPPFGVKITVKSPEVLSQFDLARVWHKDSDGWEMGTRIVPRPPDLLFLERNLQLARPGEGRVALVLPYQILSGPKLGFVREWLLRHARILAVIDLPEHTFQPWTGTKTGLVVFERREVPLPRWVAQPDDEIFMATPQRIGHDRRGNPVLTAGGDIDTDLPDIAAAWRAYSSGKSPAAVSPNAFIVSAADVSRARDLRLNAAFYHPSASGLRGKLAKSSSAIEVVRLGDVVARVWCPGRFKRSYTVDGQVGVPFIGGAGISQFFQTSGKYLHPNDPKLPELRVEPGWILLTRSGSTGIVSRVPKAWDGWAVSEHVIRITPNSRTLSGDYLEAFLRSPYGQELLAAGIFGSVIDEITPQYVEDLPIPVPRDPVVKTSIARAQAVANKGREAAASGIQRSLTALDEALGRHLR